MSPRLRLALRVLALLAATVLVWEVGSTLRRQTGRVKDLEDRVRVVELRHEQLVERLARATQASDAETRSQRQGRNGTQARADRPERQERREPPGARARESTRGMPGATFLNRLYDAADELAVEENWDDDTYDRVSLVFEHTVAEMGSLFKQVQEGRTSREDARRGVLALRDRAEQQLGAILGADGMARLKQVLVDEAP